MSTPPSTQDSASNRLLWLFSFVNLVIGSAAFVLAGILTLAAEALQTSVAAVGQGITAYALATAVLAPLLLVATGGWTRRRALVAAMALFTVGAVVCALADTLALLLAGRVLMGAGAMVTPLMSGLVVGLVEPARRGRALAFVFLGMSLSYAMGIPLGAWLGFAAGWHAPLWAGAALSALCCVLLARLVPARIDAPGASFTGLGGLLRQPALLAVLGLTLLSFTAIFTVFSYIGPVLRALAPMSSTSLSLTLAAFGLSGVAGTMLGGRAGDRFGAQRSCMVSLGVLASMMALLPLTAGQPSAMLAVMLVWGLAGFSMMAPQQARLAAMAGAHAPLALSLNASMLYLGTAAGAAVGGLAVGRLGFAQLSWAGLPFALAGLLLLAVGRSAEPLVAARRAA